MQTLQGTIGEIHPFVCGGNTVYGFTLVKAGTEFSLSTRQFYDCLFLARFVNDVTVFSDAFVMARLKPGSPVTIKVDFPRDPLLAEAGKEPDIQVRHSVTGVKAGKDWSIETV